MTDMHLQRQNYLHKIRWMMCIDRRLAGIMADEKFTLRWCSQHGKICNGSINNTWANFRTGTPTNHKALTEHSITKETLLDTYTNRHPPIRKHDDSNESKTTKNCGNYLYLIYLTVVQNDAILSKKIIMYRVVQNDKKSPWPSRTRPRRRRATLFTAHLCTSVRKDVKLAAIRKIGWIWNGLNQSITLAFRRMSTLMLKYSTAYSCAMVGKEGKLQVY